MPGRSMLACSWIPMPFRMILREPSLNAPEHVTSYRNTHMNWWHTLNLNQGSSGPDVSHLTLSLSLQVHHTHVHYGPQVSEGLHYSHIRSLVVTVHIQLQTHTNTTLALTNTALSQNHNQSVRLPTLTSWESPSLDPTNTTPLSRYVRHSAIEV